LKYQPQDLIDELEREVALRENVYPKWVQGGRMTQEKADFHLGAMKALLTTYKLAFLRPDEFREFVLENKRLKEAAENNPTVNAVATKMNAEVTRV